MDNSHKSPAPAQSGGRVHTLQHQNVLEIARNFAQNPRPTRRFEILRLLNLGAQGLGLTRAERTYLFFLVDKTQERDWSDGSPIVWWSVQRLADSLGVSTRQVNRLETSLIAKGFLTHQDSANHRRWGTRDKTTGKILQAYGVNLASDQEPHKPGRSQACLPRAPCSDPGGPSSLAALPFSTSGPTGNPGGDPISTCPRDDLGRTRRRAKTSS